MHEDRRERERWWKAKERGKGEKGVRQSKGEGGDRKGERERWWEAKERGEESEANQN